MSLPPHGPHPAPLSHAVQPDEGICGVYIVNKKGDRRTEQKAFYNHCEVRPILWLCAERLSCPCAGHLGVLQPQMAS